MTTFADPFETLFNLQRALESRTASDWMHDQTTSQGPFPPINVFQQGDDFLDLLFASKLKRRLAGHCVS